MAVTPSARRDIFRTPIRLDVHPLTDGATGIADDVRRGLTDTPKWLLPKYFYDARGLELFEAITDLPEYYQTRTELGILRREMPGVVARHEPGELVELGSGSSRKTVAILDAMDDAGSLRRYIPFDVAPGALLDAAARLVDAYPGLGVHAVAGDFERHLGEIPVRARDARRLVAFLGGTIGNLHPEERAPFLRQIRELLRPGDRFLLGTDLVKDPARLQAAYDDAAGVTAAFNLNVLAVLNRELGADFNLDHFGHVAFYDGDNAWIEMRLRSLVDQSVHVRELGLDIPFAAGEEMRTEISCKFTRDSVAQMYRDAGLELLEFHTDDEDLFAVSIAGRADDPS
jgi:L-histidine N-alpha-methyltransferase